ncbi:MAG: ferrous iron transport protein A [Phycisphaerales bacterium]|nr:ferrous iron transport protein A [Phycisphaerales bacterium]
MLTQEQPSQSETLSHESGAGWIPLTELSRGQSGRVQLQGAATEEVKMLRAMGLRPNASVTMCRHGQPCIVSLSGACGGGCRIGLAKEIAGRVMIEVDSETNG